MTEVEITDEMFNDPSNVSGLATILAPDDDDKDDLDALEASIMGADNNEVDIVEKFERSVKTFGDKLSFNLHNTISEEPPQQESNSWNKSSDWNKTTDWNQDSSDSGDDDLSVASEEPPSQAGWETNWNQQMAPQSDPPPDVSGERQKYENVDSVMNEIRDEEGYNNVSEAVHYDLQKHLDEDNRCRRLDEISELRTILMDEGVDLSSIPVVGMNSTDDEINLVHRILRVKNDRSRYINLSDELFMTVGYGLEFFFDGKTKYFGYAPDYTDYTDEVLKNRLHRVRYDTSQIISEFVEGNGLGRKSKIALEILPTLFTYNKRRKQAKYNETINDDLVDDFGN